MAGPNGGERVRKPVSFGPCPRCGRRVLESQHRYQEGAPGPIIAIYHLRCAVAERVEQQHREMGTPIPEHLQEWLRPPEEDET